MKRFEERVAVVTGASRGIGLGIAARFVQEGARVVITARKPEPLAAAVQELGGPDVALGVAGPADDPEHCEQVTQATLEAFGRIDVLVNNAGINPIYGPMASTDPEAAAKLFGVNVLAAMGWTDAVREAGLGSRPGAAIVNVASLAGLRPAAGIGVYGASKAALIHITAQLALELAPAIRVNAVAPAVVKTRFAAALYKGREKEVIGRYPLCRLGEPEDVAAAVAFLASDDAAWVTGQTLTLDGGLTLAGGIE